MNDFLDSWTITRKLTNEYRNARRSAAIGQPGFKSARELYDAPDVWFRRPKSNGDLLYTREGFPIVPVCKG